MGIPGILKEIGKGERIALAKLVVDFFEEHNRPLKLAIDVSIWQFQNQSGQGGANPAPLFIYDGPKKPSVKRNKVVSGAYQSSVTARLSKKLLQLFRFPYLTAPGEAEAECALLQKEGIVDAVMSEDVDTLMFGAKVVLKDWSSEGNRGNKSPTHVSVLHADKIRSGCGLDPYGMILVALLSGGDYDTNGLEGFGPGISCEIAKAGFGKDLIKASLQGDSRGIREWRDRLNRELRKNISGYFKRKSKASIPEEFPDQTILSYYTNPAISSNSELDQLKIYLHAQWDQDVDVPALREFTADHFDWKYKTGAKKFIRSFAPSILAHRLRRKLYDNSPPFMQGICDRRQHFDNDGMPELRLKVVPLAVAGVDLCEEQDNPGFFEQEAGQNDDENLFDDKAEGTSGAPTRDASVPLSPRKVRKSPPYDPSLPEKIWLPESIVKIGMGALVEEWEMQEREILSDPKKFASRNCVKKVNVTTTQGPIINFLKVQKKVDSFVNIDHQKALSSTHQPNQPSLQPRKNTVLETRPSVSKNAITTSREKGAEDHQCRLDRSVNPFSIAQRSIPPSEAPSYKKPTNLVNIVEVRSENMATGAGQTSASIASLSSKHKSTEKRPRPTTSESDTDLHVTRTRARKKGLQRAYTDPILINSSPPPPGTANKVNTASEASEDQVEPIASDNNSTLGPPTAHGMLLPPDRVSYETQPTLNVQSSFPPPKTADQPQTLMHKAVTSRPSLPGYYREVPHSGCDLVSSTQAGFRGKTLRVSLIDLT